MLQVMPVDGQHSVIAAEPAVLGSQAPFQQVKDKNAGLICPSDQFNAELFPGVPFVKNHLEDLLPGRSAIGMAVCPAAEAPLPQHRELQRAAGLREDGSGVVMGHVADVIVVDLKKEGRPERDNLSFSSFVEMLTFRCQRKQHCGNAGAAL